MPRYVRVLDVAGLVLLALGLSVWWGGGFRFWVGSLRVSVTSPIVPLLAGAVLVGVRHARVRHPSVLERLRRWAERVSGVDAWATAWPIFVWTRAAVLVIGLLAVLTIGFPPKGPGFRLAINEVVNLPIRWDAGWYFGIATIGYDWDPGRPSGQQNIVFFPAFPMAMRAAGRLIGSSPYAVVLGGLVVSHAAFLWALLYLYRFALQHGPPESARASIVLLATYPYSLFYGALYTESLFLLGTLATVLHYQQRRWWRALLWGTLVGLTRPNGIMLSAALGSLWLAATFRRDGERRDVAEHAKALVATAGPALGIALFSWYIGSLTGNPLQWSMQQVGWGRAFTGAHAVTGPFEYMWDNGILAYLRDAPFDMLNALPGFAALALAWPVGRRLGWPWAVYMLASIVPPMAMGGMLSIGRMTSTLFPMFVWMGLHARGDRLLRLACVFGMGQGLAAALFYTWRELY